jgi:hypothetical protein
MPEWAAQLLVQFPIFGVLCVAVAVAARYLDRKNSEYLNRIEKTNADHRDAIDRAVARYDAAIAQNDAKHEAEIGRLQQSHDAHLRSLRTENRRLEALIQQLIEQRGKES